MAERYSLTDGLIDNNELIERAVVSLRDGKLIIAPLEHGYVYLADAFNHGAVKKIHKLRQSPPATAAQVIVGDVKTVKGISFQFGETITALAEKFWPGLLTINLTPAQGLVWDLGDARALNEISVRVPNAEFVRSVALASGPLAVGAACLSGRPAPRKSTFFPALDSDYAALFDLGELPEGPSSTIIAIEQEGARLVRAGAISLADLRSVSANISVPA